MPEPILRRGLDQGRAGKPHRCPGCGQRDDGEVAVAGTLVGHVRDQNWFAQYQTNLPGVGYYEYGVNANGSNYFTISDAGAASTDVYGAFQMSTLPSGSYTVRWKA